MTVGAVVDASDNEELVSEEESLVSRVLVVDDHRTFAELLSRALDAEPDLRCVGYAQNAAEARELVELLKPDVVLMDLEMPDQDGISATSDLVRKHPDLKVLILTAHAGEREMARAGAAGASGFLAKDGSLTDVLEALRNARRGSLILPPSVLAGFANRVSNWEPSADPGLTPRELEVLQLLGQGRDPRTISKELGVSLHTCRGYVKSILAKLDAHSQLEAVVVATRYGLISVGDRA
jgi:DNA-binding NarL/FixJ family response regulator